jgi:hypothetical protein
VEELNIKSPSPMRTECGQCSIITVNPFYYSNSDRGRCPLGFRPTLELPSAWIWRPKHTKACQVSWNLQKITSSKYYLTHSLLISHRLVNPNESCHPTSAFAQLMCSCLSYTCWEQTHGNRQPIMQRPWGILESKCRNLYFVKTRHF